ncbi:MAG: RIP metalloprotease RseP [Gemmatimonadota bacterium]
MTTELARAVLSFIVVLGVLIVVHELGHFVTAKLAGIAVPRFSVGLGPKVWSVKVGETEYAISALPLGGYVKLAGMGEEEALEALEGGPADVEVPPERRFDSKSLGTRAVVISAGVVMNFLFAIVAFAGLAFWRGELIPLIGEVQEDSPAAEAGLRAGDLILAVDDQEMKRWVELSAYVYARPAEEVDLLIEREGAAMELHAQTARMIQVDSARGDTIVYGQLGIRGDTIHGRVPLSATVALWRGTQEASTLTVLILDFLGDLVTGRASARELGGPILIGQISGEAARAGLATFINFMALLSVHLAVLNLLPIPILDGGHLLFLAIEGVRGGRALSSRARARLSQFGFIFILALMVWVIASDVLRITGH